MKENYNPVIVVVGTGYVGMSISVLLARYYEVIAIDIISEKVNMINNRISPVHDDYIEYYMQSKKLNLIATLDEVNAYEKADYVIICTSTNYDHKKSYFDTSSVESIIEKISMVNENAIIVIKSTVPIGFTNTLSAKYPNLRILFSPEFLRESRALYDNFYPSRVIVGCEDEDKMYAMNFAEMLQQAAIKEKVDILYMGTAEAESVKLFSNTYLALRVSFFNELDTYAEIEGLNTYQIIKGVSLDPRIGDYYNNPSFGYGGYCLPKDTKQLLANYRDIPEKLISAVIESNIIRKNFVADAILKKATNCKKQCQNYSSGNLCIIGIYRLTMKSDSDNFRYSSVQSVMRILHKKGAIVVVYEPLLSDEITFCGFKIINDLDEFKDMCQVIVANRFNSVLEDVKYKVYTRDIFDRD